MIWIIAYSFFLNPAERLIQGIKSKKTETIKIKGKKSLFLLNRVISLTKIQGILGEMKSST